jgi:MbtH protein
MPDPFEDPDSPYLALCNDEEQYSLWPLDIDIPAGWRAVFGPARRDVVVDHIERTWTDMRPRSLRS